MATAVQVGSALKPRVYNPASYAAVQGAGAVGGSADSPYEGKQTPGGAAPTGSLPSPPPGTVPLAGTPIPSGPPSAGGPAAIPMRPGMAGFKAPAGIAPATPGSAAAGALSKGTPEITQAPGQMGFLGGNEQKFVDANAAAVKGYGDMAGEDMTRNIGLMLGDLNGIGGLRSGGVQAGIDQAAKEYGRQIGDYSKMTATESTKMAQEENDLQIERAWRSKMYNAAKAASQRRGLGKLLGGIAGGVIGFFAGGPAGAVSGAQLGSKIGGG